MQCHVIFSELLFNICVNNVNEYLISVSISGKIAFSFDVYSHMDPTGLADGLIVHMHYINIPAITHTMGLYSFQEIDDVCIRGQISPMGSAIFQS